MSSSTPTCCVDCQPAHDLTPASAEYASGHATFSAAAAEVLIAFTGRGNFELKVAIGAGTSRVEPGAVPAKAITLSWTNFHYAAGQAGLPREYAGASFEHGDKMPAPLGPVWARTPGPRR
jgi:hypothetical protein